MPMRRWTKITVAILLSLLVGLPAGSAWAGGSRTHVVRPGESIQAAIDAARPGSASCSSGPRTTTSAGT
jgi:hypothetical protein